MKILIKKFFNKLKKKQLTISITESCTGGLLSYYLTSLPGSSKIFKMGLIAYSNSSKNKLLNINNKTLLKYGAVSRKVCILMVKNINKISKTDLSISITGIAGPSGGTDLKPIGLVFVGIKNKKKIICEKFLFKKKERSFIQKEAVKKSLKLMLKHIN